MEVPTPASRPGDPDPSAAAAALQPGYMPFRPTLSLPRLLEMNLGFLGLQFSFGLQQGNMSPIYS